MMTKSLTEKWKDGELKEGEYYCKITESPYIERVHLPCLGDVEFMVEVLAPVPSYDHFSQKVKKVEQLQERLADADKALKAMDEKYGEHYTIADGTRMGNSPAWKYMLKWGLK